MGFIRTLLRDAFAPSSPVDMLEGATGENLLRAFDLIRGMPPGDAVPMLLQAVSKHRSDDVRCHCITALLSYDLTEDQIRMIASVLDHPSAKVRFTAVGYFGLRGSRGRPVTSIVPNLVTMLQNPNQSTKGDPFEEKVLMTGLPETIASALKLTVGAEMVMPSWDTSDSEGFDLEGFRLELDLK